MRTTRSPDVVDTRVAIRPRSEMAPRHPQPYSRLVSHRGHRYESKSSRWYSARPSRCCSLASLPLRGRRRPPEQFGLVRLDLAEVGPLTGLPVFEAHDA